ncbi:MAG: flippase-like domain-containing protein, partial [Deltaproteobacteria bacterium]|nr:flippase-like domain-containing protein [Deltaproteobacteria bacterium]
MKKVLSLLLKIAISSTILFYLFKRTDTGLFWETIGSVKPSFFFISLMLYAGDQVLSTYRWSLLLATNGLRISFPRLVSLYYIGMFFNNLLPTLVGGDLVKGYYLYRLSGQGGKTLASIFVDRYAGFFALITISLVSLLFGYPYIKNTSIPWLIILMVLGFFSISLILWVKGLHDWALQGIGRIKVFRINERLESFYEAVMAYKGKPMVLLKVLGISFIIQIVGIFAIYIISRGFALSIPIGYFFLFIPLAISIAMIPVSFAGLGLREGAFVFLFGKVGVSPAEALSLSLAWFFVTVF